MAAVEACRKDGYNVSAVVLDRAGNVQVALRDTRAARGDPPELKHIEGLIVMEDGLPIRAAGNLTGAVGVSGAPGGGKNAVCAAAALQKAEERLEFAR